MFINFYIQFRRDNETVGSGGSGLNYSTSVLVLTVQWPTHRHKKMVKKELN